MILGTATGKSASATAKVRAVLAMLCVSLFMLSGFLHAIQHVDTVANTAAAELSVGGVDDGSSAPAEKAAIASEHCCGCTTVAFLPQFEASSPCTIGKDVTPQPPLRLAGHTVDYDPPPPKA